MNTSYFNVHSTGSPRTSWFQIPWSPLFRDLISCTNYVNSPQFCDSKKKKKLKRKNFKNFKKKIIYLYSFSTYLFLEYSLEPHIMKYRNHLTTCSYHLVLSPALTTRSYHLILPTGLTAWSYLLVLPPGLTTWFYHLVLLPGLTTWSYSQYFLGKFWKD